jgi:hypothetical protein
MRVQSFWYLLLVLAFFIGLGCTHQGRQARTPPEPALLLVECASEGDVGPSNKASCGDVGQSCVVVDSQNGAEMTGTVQDLEFSCGGSPCPAAGLYCNTDIRPPNAPFL